MTTASPLRSLPTLQHISLPEQPLIAFCQQWQITQLALFGSVLRPDFNPITSDIDILVDFSKTAQHTLLDFAEMQEQLTHLFQRKVDLVSRKGVENSRNPERRQHILTSAQTIYGARLAAPEGHVDLSSASDKVCVG